MRVRCFLSLLPEPCRSLQIEPRHKTGIQRCHISRIEMGRYSVGFDTLQSIAEALGGNIDIVE